MFPLKEISIHNPKPEEEQEKELELKMYIYIYCTLILNQLLGLPKQVEIHHGSQYW